ncbi:MAG: AAA domain-containing protein [Arcicella sp.]|nr:AAA domain-containing protein [Arcicella sp.]
MPENSLKTILKSYQKRLTNLSSRNKSLLLLNLSTEQFLDMHELDFLQNKPSFNVIEQLIAQKNTISLCEIHDPRYERVNEISKRLRKISRTEKFIVEERGSEDLYVGYPIVMGKFSDGTVVRCPLLFFPVHLTTKEGKIWQIETRDEAISFNRTFLLAYSHFSEVKISDEFLEHSFEDYAKDSLEFRTQLYEFLKDSTLKLNFNKELFTNELQYFEKSTKANLELLENNGELKLFPQAVLGIFPQAGSFLVPDYEELLSAIGNQPSALGDNSLETLFPNNNNDEQFSTADSRQPIAKIKEENLLTPFAIDATQELALRQVKSGSSLVVQGPPGTGKSQLICNLVADFTARGKKVLVVCQKRAALDVVQERLTQAGMRAFVGNVHDFKNDRKELYSQVLNQIEQIEEYQKQNNSLDAIFLDRNFTQESRQIDKISETLQEFKDALFDTDECGVSVKELYLTSSPNQPFLGLKSEYKSFKFNDIGDFLRKFERYISYYSVLNSEQFPAVVSVPTDHNPELLHPWSVSPLTTTPSIFWQKRLSFKNRQYSEILIISSTIEVVSDFVQNLEKESAETLNKPINFNDLVLISFEREALKNLILTIGNDKIYQVFSRNIQEKLKLTTSKISEIEKEVASFFAGQGIEITLASSQLLPFLSKLNQAIDSKSNAIGGLFWGIFSKEKADIQNVTIANGLGLSLDDLQKLRQRIHNRIGLEKWWQENGFLFDTNSTQPSPSGRDFPASEPIWLRKGIRWFERHFQQLYQAERANKIWKPLVKTNPAIFENWHNLSWNKFQNRANFIIQKLQELVDNQLVWKNYLSEKQIELLVGYPLSVGEGAGATDASGEVIIYLKEHFDSMQEADTLKEDFTKNEWQIIERFLPETEPISIFTNSLKLSWIEHIEEKYPVLRSVSSLKINQLEEELQKGVQKKQELSQEILLLKLREFTYKNLEKNRLQNVITYRDLKHQVAKKRKLWSIRKLISEHSEEIFKLVPCWLASPETVSAILPLQTENEAPFFDLIIFDEASQCFAEQGIPALFRGKQVVIAGDSKQLQPNDLYRVRFETETDDLPELEIDSLLDLACQYLPQTQLKGHYRSNSLDLIDFSNRYFYKNTLSLLPDFQDINLQKPAIEYIKVEGVWENNTNPIEAENVISLVQKLTDELPNKSIGIVTFNAKQQGVIQDLLETKTIKFTHPIFIKNIENVQGDERDIIIFSVGYAPDAKGKMNMQFGSLNAQGGENRLNVAITRAKEKIYVISSILPNQLRVEEAQNEGPKLLKSYLEYALMVSEGKYKPTPHRSEKYQANWLLKEQLLKHNSFYIKELPFTDLTVKNNQQYKSLILTDDDLYYESLSPKETFVYIPAGLRAKGWKFERIFSRNFWKRS